MTIASKAEAEALAAAALAAGTRARVHLKVETGLNRFGLRPDEAVALAEALRDVNGLEVEGIATHLASVDEGDKTFTYQQYEAFQLCAERLPWVPLHHIAVHRRACWTCRTCASASCAPASASTATTPRTK